MNKLEEALQKQINRFKSINTYQDKLVSEGIYYFHQQLPEADEEDPAGDPGMDTQEPTAAPEDPNAAPDPNTAPVPQQGGAAPAVDPGMDPNAGGDAMGGQPPAEPGMDDMGADPSMGADPAMGADPMAAGGQDTEVDVTELVNNSNEIKMKVTDAVTKLDQSNQQFNNIIAKVTAIEGSLGKMDSLVSKMEQLAKEVALMRPPTEEERRKALTQGSYPYNVSLEDYNKGEGAKTQTDLEKNKDPKMSMMKTLMADYNDSAVKDSFYTPEKNPFNNM